MFSHIKGSIKRLRAEGRARILTRVFSFLWFQVKSLRDYRFKSQVIAALDNREFPLTPEGLVSFVMDRFGGSLSPIQDRTEILELIKYIQEKKPKVAIEIGTARGGTLFLLCQSLPDDALILSIDLPCGPNGGGYPRWKENLFQKMKKEGQELILIRQDSHSSDTLEMIRRSLCGRNVDFLLIDGDHSYIGVKTDYELYSRLVAVGGTIALHDIVENTYDPEIDVARFWGELRKTKRTREIIRSPTQLNLGIGLVFLDEIR